MSARRHGKVNSRKGSGTQLAGNGVKRNRSAKMWKGGGGGERAPGVKKKRTMGGESGLRELAGPSGVDRQSLLSQKGIVMSRRGCGGC